MRAISKSPEVPAALAVLSALVMTLGPRDLRDQSPTRNVAVTIHAAAWLSLLIAAAGVTRTAAADDGYAESIVTHRRTVDEVFRTSAISPIPDSDIPGFAGLHYFPVDPAMRMETRFEPAADTAVFRMPTFNNQFMDFSKYGYLIYPGGNSAGFRLTLFQPKGSGTANKTVALLPFRDLSNGEATYSGGRYLEITLPLSDPPIVDFNLAFNPYCAYEASFACPIPPEENRLDFPVFAGEKAYHQQGHGEND